ncbi:PREDICTED: WD repeat-containing protein RUP1-like [Camelina sativa]|uniref:WD repeat-containing protein RUP1-like n=1 Tax=Camelina sativa TaxID=90675 RepID=A0ABM0UQM9_CAMSA|nr:PREDICTED: WD repeat-containing protein RUP1-like [Camelina sativa]
MEALFCSEIPNNNIRSSINDLSYSSSSSSSSYTWPMIMTSSSSLSHTIMETDNNIPRCDWDLSLSAVVSSASTGSDAIGTIEFDPTGEIIATGGIARKIRTYRLSSLLRSRDDHVTASESCICTPAKLSSLRWRPDLSGRVIGSGDYDGVVTEYDVEKQVPVFERDEHGGRRIGSMDYTLHNGSLIGASGSDDGTVQMWDPRNGGSLEEMVRPGGGAAVCSVEFDPFGGASLAVGCADRNAYVYDIRRLVDPLIVLDGHTKTVTYARFMDPHTIVTGSTDGSLKQWDINNGRRVVRTYRGHVNSRNFVGLSVWRHGGLVVSGSENNQVFVYDKRWEEPVWVCGLGQTDRFGSDRRFVSSVCLRQVDEDWCTLVAGGSDGVLEIFSGKRS